MAKTYHQIFIQTVFAFKFRQAMLNKPWRSTVFAVMGNLINESGCKNLIVNGVEDHVHCFFSVPPSVTISEVMKVVKAKSSKYINDNGLTSTRFEWQRGFGAFSYSKSSIENVYRYIERQEQHHMKASFKSEYLKFLRDFKITYNDQDTFQDPI